VKPADGVAWLTHDGTVYVARLPSGPILVLEGSAALIWTELVLAESDAALVSRVRRHVTGSSRGLAADVRGFVDQLRAERWVVGGDPDTPGAQSAIPYH
jgi:hypothetical protein